MIKSIEKILVPIDESEPSLHAAWIAYSIARSLNATMTLIHIHIQENALRELVVINKDELSNLSDERFENLLTKIVGDPSYPALQSAADHSAVAIESCTFVPSDEICKYAEENNINLIVMGSRIHSKLEDILLGSVSSEVLKKAPCPVTIVH